MSPIVPPAATTSRSRRTVPVAALATVVLAVAPAAPAGAIQDLRSPDARDAAGAAASPQPPDLRSPDARDAAGVAARPHTQDLRSPDARDASRPAPPPTQDLRSPDVRDATRPSPGLSPAASPADTDRPVALLAGGAAALALFALGAMLLLTRRSGRIRDANAPLPSS
jgi:hypothetical protein